ncbi:MAG: hypothetical protein IID45_04835, partial [Planctomycetes bacterium]|nr:hypothetical protein [Planctomycetota bacterium]
MQKPPGKKPAAVRRVVNETEIPSPTKTRVIAAMQQARRLFENRKSSSDEFRRVLQSVAADLPELKVSTDPHRVEWNRTIINQSGVRFDALRFRSPLKSPAEMYWTFVTPDVTGNWFIIPAKGTMKGFGGFRWESNFQTP